MNVSSEVIIAAIGSIAAFCSGLVWWTLKRSEKIQDIALERWKEQTEALQKVGNSIDAVGLSLAKHDELNGVAHRKAAEIMQETASMLKEMKGMG